ncbi:hypothetical protein AXZ95_1053 [Leifsonia sp. 115AMFTsu3.1]|nr:hypothetical protein AXZ95_1053 [Leifsonia sp. 115AMFTsu3.1]
MNPMVEHNGFALIAVAVVLLGVLSAAVAHALVTRRTWRDGEPARTSNVRKLVGAAQTFNAVWGLDTIYAVKKIAKLRGGSTRPRVSPHFVVTVSSEGLSIVHGHRGDQGLTVVHPAEFRGIQTGVAGPGAYTAWYLSCEVEGAKVTLPIRVSHPSSDFLVAEYAWAQEAAAAISEILGPQTPPR